MESQKKASSPSSCKFTSELFGSTGEFQRTSSPSASASAGIFASVVPPPPTASGIHQHEWGSKKGSPGMGQQEKGQPCHLSSSLYYGGRDMYSSSSSTTNPAAAGSIVKKDKEDDGSNGNTSQGASRGNWWQGSLYY